MRPFKRELPTLLPETAPQLRARGVSDGEITRNYERVTHNTWIHRSNRQGEQHDIITRTRAHHLTNPTRPATGWSVLAYHGLPYWADAAPAVFASEPRSRKNTRIVLGPHVKHFPQLTLDKRLYDPRMPSIRCVPIELAMVSALRSIRDGTMQWHVPNIPGWAPKDVRAVQLLDAAIRHAQTKIELETFTQAAAHKLDKQWAQRIRMATDTGADSPMETLLRLTLKQVNVGSFPLRWESQVPVYDDGGLTPPGGPDRPGGMDGSGRSGRTGGPAKPGWAGERGKPGWASDSTFRPWITVADLMCKELKVIVLYDGAHHRTPEQHRKDAEINAFLQSKGYRVLRVTADMLKNPELLRVRAERLLLSAINEREEMGW